MGVGFLVVSSDDRSVRFERGLRLEVGFKSMVLRSFAAGCSIDSSIDVHSLENGASLDVSELEVLLTPIYSNPHNATCAAFLLIIPHYFISLNHLGLHQPSHSPC